MDKDITVEGLHRAVKLMAAEKCPGPDGATTKFFAQRWPVIGPVLHAAALEVILSGRLDKAFIRSYLVLLAKKGDPTLFTNKRPLTMLSTLYKVIAKAYQLLLTSVLKHFITAQQSACLLGQSFHHFFLVMAHLLHQAQLSTSLHTLLKLDMLKAFDMVVWGFLTTLLAKYGFGHKVAGFLKES
jgi:hypothetical protein